MLRKLSCSLLVVSGLALALPAVARDLTVVGFGGAAQESFRVTLFKAFTETTGLPLQEDEWDGQLAKVRAQIESGAVTWDVILSEGAEVRIGCDEGLFEKLDWSKIAKPEDLYPPAVHPCGLGVSSWSSALAYDGDKLADGPKSWVDFWDVQKFPGKRGMRFSPKETLQQALMADGVAPADVSRVLAEPGGVDRAFKKLAELKPHILWWKSGAESIQRLAAGEVVMTAAWNGRPWTANKNDGRHFVIAWSAGHVLGVDSWAVLKGSENADAAHKLLALWATPEIEAPRMELIPYSGPNVHVYELLSPELSAQLPTSPANLPYAAPIDYDFWVDNLESLNERFTAWVNQ
jgi:putative spermidine/putrescine transport system substrate-binding protein